MIMLSQLHSKHDLNERPYVQLTVDVQFTLGGVTVRLDKRAFDLNVLSSK